MHALWDFGLEIVDEFCLTEVSFVKKLRIARWRNEAAGFFKCHNCPVKKSFARQQIEIRYDITEFVERFSKKKLRFCR